MKKILFIITLLFSNHYLVVGQSKQISGIIKDETGPLQGATVTEKGVATNATVSDVNGKFVLNLKSDSYTIIVTSIGYVSQQMDVKANNNLSITLTSDLTSFEDVVVVGYGAIKKPNVTGAISSISGTELQKNPSPNLQNALAGRVTGFSSEQRGGQPGKDRASFNIRGISTFDGSNSPLIIVDDIEFSYDQFANLNANEIESLSILKDASTTAIYGIKGANGVVLVTTIRGKTGKPKISFISEYALSTPAIFPKFLNAFESASLFRKAQENQNNSEATPNPNFPFRHTPADLELFKNGTDPYGHPDNNWKELLFKKYAKQLKNVFNISGGTEKTKYFVSLGYLDQGGQGRDYSVDLNSQEYYKRYNYRSNIDLAVTKDLDLRFDLFGSVDEQSQNNSGGNLFDLYGRQNETSPYNYPIYNPDGSLGYSLLQRTVFDRNNNNLIGRLMYGGYTRNFNNNINLLTSANQKLNFITKGLSVKAVVSYRSFYDYQRSLNRPNNGFQSYIYIPATNSYTFGQTENTYRLATPSLSYNAGSTNRSLTLQGILNYSRSFKSHNVSGLFLYNLNSKSSEDDPDNPNDDEYNFIPENFRGYTARVGYDYASKYIIQLSGAYNATDRFGGDGGNRLGFFPAVSAGWNVAEEQFIKKNFSFINQFRLRGSYGLSGSDGTNGVYSYKRIYSSGTSTGLFGTSPNNPSGSLVEGTLPSDEVTWEKEEKLDLGLDFAFFNSKLSGAISYFNNYRNDILTQRGDISNVFGNALPKVNVGKTNNRGYELELSFRNTVGGNRDLTYSLRGTYSVAKNKILFRGEAISSAVPWQATTGHPINSIIKYTWSGKYYSQADLLDPKVPKPTALKARPGDFIFKDINGDNVIDDADQSVFGNTNIPNTVYGFQFNVGYKNIQLQLAFQGVTGVTSSSGGALTFPTVGNLREIHKQHWTPELGDNAIFPQLYTVSALQGSGPTQFPNDFWQRSADYLRLKTAELSYSFGPKVLKRLKIQGLRIYTNGYNLLTWSKFADFYELDPEVAINPSGYNYPPNRSYNLGLNVTF